MRVPRLNEPGQQMKRIREKLLLKYRDVAEASQRIARQHGNREFAIGLSRLADIENKGTVPSIYRLYSLGTIYGMELNQMLATFGVNVAQMPADSCGSLSADAGGAISTLMGALRWKFPCRIDNAVRVFALPLT